MEYTFKTKQMVKVADRIGKKYDLEKAVYDNDISKLAILISIFGDIDEEQAYEEIDKALENKKTINDLYKEIIKGINEKGFFKEKIQANMDVPPVDLESMMNKMYQDEMNKGINKELDKMKILDNM